MHFILEGFRPANIKSFTYKVCATCQRLAGLVLQGETMVEDEVLRSLDTTFEELVSLMPEAKGVSDSPRKIKDTRMVKKRESLVSSLFASFSALAILEPLTDESRNEVSAKVAALNDLTLSMQEPLVMGGPNDEVVITAWRRLVEFMSTRCVQSDEFHGEALKNQLANLLHSLPELLGVTIVGSDKVADSFALAVEFQAKFARVTPKNMSIEEAQKKVKNVEPLKNLRRCQLKIEKAGEELSGMKELRQETWEGWVTFLTSFEDKSKDATKITDYLQNNAKQNLEYAVKGLKSVAGGRKGGGKWSDALKPGTKWPVAQAKWKDKLLFDMDNQHMATAMDTLSEDWREGVGNAQNMLCCTKKEKKLKSGVGSLRELWGRGSCNMVSCCKAVKLCEWAMAVTDKQGCEALLKEATDVLNTSQITKRCACLLEALASGKEPGKVRSLVQSELKDLRNLIGKDKSEFVLPAVLKEKAEKVLEGH